MAPDFGSAIFMSLYNEPSCSHPASYAVLCKPGLNVELIRAESNANEQKLLCLLIYIGSSYEPGLSQPHVGGGGEGGRRG